MKKGIYSYINKFTDNHLALPGGRVEVLENSQSCMIREMKEELGFDVKLNRLFWITENYF